MYLLHMMHARRGNQAQHLELALERTSTSTDGPCHDCAEWFALSTDTPSSRNAAPRVSPHNLGNTVEPYNDFLREPILAGSYDSECRKCAGRGDGSLLPTPQVSNEKGNVDAHGSYPVSLRESPDNASFMAGTSSFCVAVLEPSDRKLPCTTRRALCLAVG